MIHMDVFSGVFIAFRLQPRSALQGTSIPVGPHIESSLPFGFNHVPHRSIAFIGPHAAEVFIAFRLQPRSARSLKVRVKDSEVMSSLPFGFNHVPHETLLDWTGLKFIFVSSLPFGFNHVPHEVLQNEYARCHKVFIAFRLQPRSAH